LLLHNPDLPCKRHQNQHEHEQEPVAAAGDVNEGQERIPGKGPRIGPAVRAVGNDYYLKGLCIVLVDFHFNKNNLLNRIVR
jgi:hypothetical protein